MPAFRFRLAGVMKLREAARDERRAELAEAFRADDLLRRQAESVDGELDTLRRDCRSAAGPGPVNVDRLLEGQRYELLLTAQQRQLDANRQLLAGEIERRRQALVQANRDVRVLEKLRQRQADRHREEEEHRQIRLLDEIAQQRFVGTVPSRTAGSPRNATVPFGAREVTP